MTSQKIASAVCMSAIRLMPCFVFVGCGNSSFPQNLQLAVDDDSNLVLVWCEHTTGKADDYLLFTRSTDGGVNWAPPRPINTNAASEGDGDRDPQLAVDDSTNWIAVWSSGGEKFHPQTDRRIHVARSTDQGSTWTTPRALTGDDYVGLAFEPQVASGAQDTIVALWVDSTPDDPYSSDGGRIVFARSTDGGVNWPDPQPIASTASNLSPQLATDGEGVWVAAWLSISVDNAVFAIDADMFSSRSADHGATWSAPERVYDAEQPDSTYDDAPQLVTDGAGTWIAMWESNTIEPCPTDEGYVSRVLFSRSTDNGLTWTTTPQPLYAGAPDCNLMVRFQLATDRHGLWIAAWESITVDSEGRVSAVDVLCSRSTDKGENWTEPQVLIPGSRWFSPALATDRAGLWVAVWEQGNELAFSRSLDDGLNWSDPQLLYFR